MLQRLGIPADIVRRIAIGTYEAEMNVIIHAGGGNVAAEVFPDATVNTVPAHGPGPPEINKVFLECCWWAGLRRLIMGVRGAVAPAWACLIW